VAYLRAAINSNVDGNGYRSSHTLELMLLQKSQKFRLEILRYQNGSTLRQFDLVFFAAQSPRLLK
jgi:hypothetical protein